METYEQSIVKIADIIIDFKNAKAYPAIPQNGSDNSEALEVDLDDKSLLLVQLLLSAENYKLSRDDLLTKIWDDRIVSDDSLTNLVSQTRSRIKQISSSSIIRTIPKKGYGLQGDVTISNQNGKKEQSSQTQTVFNSKVVAIALGIIACITFAVYIFINDSNEFNETIAVLPFQAFSDDTLIQNSAQSFTEELTHQLTNYPALKVISRTLASSISTEELSPEQISQSLGSRFFIEGSIRENDDTLRLTLQLIDGTSGVHILSQVIDSPISEYKVQREEIIQKLSRLIVSEIPFTLEPVSDKELAIYTERCDRYLDIAMLYANHILLNIESIAAQAEPACVALTQISEDPRLLSKPAELYLFMAAGSIKERSQRLSYLKLGRNYVDKGLASVPDDKISLIVSLNLWSYELNDSLYYDSDPEIAFEQLQIVAEKALSLYPDNSEIIGNYAIAMRRYGVALARKGQSPIPYFEKGINLFKDGIRLFPDDEDFVHNLGRLYASYASYLSSQDLDSMPMLLKSIQHYESSIEMKPDYYNAYVNNGNAYQSLTKILAANNEPYEEALAKTRLNYAKALEHSERKQQVHNNLAALNSSLAKIELERGQSAIALVQQGIAEAQQALAIQPDYTWPHFNLMNLYYYKHYEEFANNGNAIVAGQECIDIATKGHELKGNLASTWHTMSQCAQITVRMYLESNRYEAAGVLLDEIDAWLKHAIELNPQAASGYQILGTNQLLQAYASKNQMDSYDTVIQSFEQALELSPDKPEVKLALLEALTFYQKFHPSKVATRLEQIWKTIEPDEKPQVGFHLLSFLLTHPTINKDQWQNEVLKQQEQYGLLATYHGREYRYLVGNALK
ncbi:winged helix-turn-helix domain-containing protein [Glaciecola sp. 1036]|uniref:winged helix-turn-helix domain-containing protein n=1 Tax=Alteromonadaceae TaxID=72275 RepID=UPI003CFD7AC9